MGNEYILVVEDGDFIRNLVQSHLEKGGFEVKTAATVSKGLLEIRTRMPDILILDLTLEEDDPFAGVSGGFGFLGVLRHNHPEANPAIIIFSVNHTPEVESRAKAMGVHSVVGKKDGMRPLLNAVRAVLEERKRKETEPTAVHSPETTQG